MSVLADRPYWKMNGLGNEIVVADLRGVSGPIEAEAVRALSATPGFAFDQLMVLRDPASADTAAFVRIYNTDGSEAGACGNGMRCVGWVLLGDGARDHVLTETRAGRLEIGRDAALVYTVDMGRPRFDWRDIPLSEPFADTRFIELEVGPLGSPLLSQPSVVNMGNPHCVFFVEDTGVVDLGRVGPMIEHHPLFPDRVNVSLARVIDRRTIALKVWERGAGLTRACGSAACAAVVSAAARRRLTERTAAVDLPGGRLTVAWGEDDRVRLTGPVELERAGTIPAGVFAGRAA